MTDGKGSVLERMAFTATDLKRQLAADPSDTYKVQLLGRLNAEVQAQRAEAFLIRGRLAGQNDAGSRAVVAYLDALL